MFKIRGNWELFFFIDFDFEYIILLDRGGLIKPNPEKISAIEKHLT